MNSFFHNGTILLASFALGASCASGAVIHVRADASPGGSGTSWALATNDLSAALGAAQPGDEVWIARGTYTAPGGQIGFSVPSGVRVLGGFTGNESQASARPADPQPLVADPAFDTVLSGEVGAPGPANNSWLIVRMENTGADTLLERVAITGANSPTSAGGLYAFLAAGTVRDCLIVGNTALQGSGLRVSSPNGLVISGCNVMDNTAVNGGIGAGMLVDGGTMTVENSLFRGNETDYLGGGMAFTGCNATVRDCVIEEGEAVYGGGLYADGGAVFERCVIRNNNAFSPFDPTGATRGFGGGIYTKDGPIFRECDIVDNTGVNSGGMANEGTLGSSYYNCRFLRNTSSGGGGAAAIIQQGTLFAGCLFLGNNAFSSPVMYLRSFPQLSSVTFVNCTVVDNGTGQAAVNIAGTALVLNSIFRNPGDEFSGNFPGVGWSNVEGYTGGLFNVNADPMFVDPPSGDYRLRAGSPCIDAGRNDQVPLDLLDDLAGEFRYLDDPSTIDSGVGPAPVVDMGAYEFRATPLPCFGDADNSRSVNFADITMVLANLGAGGEPFRPGDASGDGAVNFNDITIVLANLGSACS